MKNDYNYFHKLLIAWYQGEKTGNEIKKETKDILDLNEYEEDFDVFIYAFEESLNEFDDDIGYGWEDYKELAEDTAPTIKGVCHNISQFLSDNQTIEDVVDWATWHNLDGGETTNGQFENSNIEFFCLYFIPENYKDLDVKFYQTVKPLIEKSNTLTYGEFIIALYLLLEKEQKSMYFFFKDYINGTKNENDLKEYLVNKFNRNLPDFNFGLSAFTHIKELNRFRNKKLNIDDFIESLRR